MCVMFCVTPTRSRRIWFLCSLQFLITNSSWTDLYSAKTLEKEALEHDFVMLMFVLILKILRKSWTTEAFRDFRAMMRPARKNNDLPPLTWHLFNPVHPMVELASRLYTNDAQVVSSCQGQQTVGAVLAAAPK